jgi:nucleoside-diphosphate-sugar epimerase
MRVAIIGGSGHIGTYLTPRLVEAGCDVTCVSRGLKEPYRANAAWRRVRRVEIDRTAHEDAETFGETIAALDAHIVIDITCYTPESARQLVEGLRGRIDHLLHCGTIWVHGHSVEVPTTEEAPREPFGEYGIRKAEIERCLLSEAREHALPVTILHPGHLVGEGWNPINPQGNFEAGVFSAMMRGEPLTLPNFGMETVHHVHADDVAQAFVQAILHRDASLGQSFHVVSDAALTLRGYAERMFDFFQQPSRLEFLPFEEWSREVSEKAARTTRDHIAHSPNCSIAKARRLLGYAPQYSSLQAVQQSVMRLREMGVIGVA